MSNDCGAKTIETQEMSGRRNDLYRMKGMDVKLLCVAKKKGESRGVRKEESKESGCPESETNRLHLRGRLQGTMVMRVYIEIQLDTHTCMHTRSICLFTCIICYVLDGSGLLVASVDETRLAVGGFLTRGRQRTAWKKNLC